MKVLSVVCARAGSKGLKNKCITKIENKMVIEHSIEYSLSLGSGIKTVVSTDIDIVIEYCRQNNIEYIRRDPELCKDVARIDGVLADVIERKGQSYELCSLVYGNIPTRYPKMFHKALSFLGNHKDYDAIISMQNVGKFNPAWMFDYNEELLPKESKDQYRRQDLPQKMIHDGHTFLFRSEKFYERYKGLSSYDKIHVYSVYGDRIKPLINNEIIIDIDTEKDLRLAETLITKI